jgi:pyruvate,water dikinase
VTPVARRKLPPSVGAKAQNLLFLRRRGFHTPETFVVPWDVQHRFDRGDASVVDILRSELARRLDIGRRYAVRSSADVEDSSDYSFAGQFATLLDVEGIDAIVSAILSIWESASKSGVSTYRQHTVGESDRLRMAVIIQEMVNPLVSGVSFSANPITGMSETIVEAVQGSGALVQEGVTPLRWVHKWGAYVIQPDVGLLDAGEYRIPPALIDQVIADTEHIARAYGRPVDLEWVWDGHHLHWVQLRAITSLDIPIYSNRISREVLPGLIKPLVWSINVPLVNGAWVRFLTEMVGPNKLDPSELARSFYGRAYFNFSALGDVFDLLGMPRETLELILGLEAEGPDKPSFRPGARSLRLLPRMVHFAWTKLRLARRLEESLSPLQSRFRSLAAVDLDAQAEEVLLEAIDQLFDLAQQVAYLNIVAMMLATGSRRILSRQLARDGIDIDTIHVTHGMDSLRELDPTEHLAQLRRRLQQLPPGVQERVRVADYEELQRVEGAELLWQGMQDIITRFGHISDAGTDFSSAPWREQPEMIWRLVVDETPPPTERSASGLRFDEIPLSPLRRLLLQPLCRATRRYRLCRESVSSLYTYGYGQFRPYTLALGRRLRDRGLLDAAEDILFLDLAEVRRAVSRRVEDDEYRRLVRERREEMARFRDIDPPSVIFGDEPLPLENGSSDTLRGVPTSRGYYTGPVTVVRGLQDFDKLSTGDVLVVPYSDVGWTPLFARAAAVVAESGGLLSHSSIVAREYGIPAVVSVPAACSLEDGTMVTVDGYSGKVSVQKQDIAVVVSTPLPQAKQARGVS